MAAWSDDPEAVTARRQGCAIALGGSLLAWAIIVLLVWTLLR